MGPAGAGQSARVFSQRTEQDVHAADEHDGKVGKHVQLQLRAADDEKDGEEGRGPVVRRCHQILRQGAEVAEYRAQHHADQQGGEAQGDRANPKLQHGQRRGKKHESNGHVPPVGVGVKQGLQLCQQKAHEGAQSERGGDLQQGIDQDGGQLDRPAVQRPRNPKGDGEHHQAHGVVQRDHGQQEVCQRSLCLILPHDHQRGRGRCGGGNGAQRDGLRCGQLVRQSKMQKEQGQIHKQGCGQRLHHAHHEGLPAGMLQAVQPEFVADCEGDETQRDFGYQGQRFHRFHGGKAEPVNAQGAQTVWPDQYAGHQISGNIGKLQRPDEPRHQQAGQQCNGNGK